MENEALKQLAKEYALVCNEQLLGKENRGDELWFKILSLPHAERKVICDECKRLVFEKELPLPVLVYWAAFWWTEIIPTGS